MPSPEEKVIARCEEIAKRYGEACAIFDSELDELCAKEGVDPGADALIEGLVDLGWEHMPVVSRDGADAPGIIKRGGEND